MLLTNLAHARWKAAAAAVLLVVTGDAAAAMSVRIISSATVTGHRIARDIRWASPSEVYVALGPGGVIRAPVSMTSELAVVPQSGGSLPMAGRIATGQKHVVLSSIFGSAAAVSMEAGAKRNVALKTALTITGIDARGDRVAILGADRGDLKGLARDGVIAWIGSISTDFEDVRPLMTGRTKPGGKDMARCSLLETGAIRFMRDGSVVVFPGVEPGIYQFSDEGKLLHIWDTTPLGVIDDCPADDDVVRLFARDVPRRYDWLAARPLVDGIVPFRSGPALLVRHVKQGVSSWELVTLPFSGRGERVALPITVPSSHAHARADIRGDRIALIIFDDPLPNGEPVVSQRIVVLSISGQ